MPLSIIMLMHVARVRDTDRYLRLAVQNRGGQLVERQCYGFTASFHPCIVTVQPFGGGRRVIGGRGGGTRDAGAAASLCGNVIGRRQRMGRE